VHGLAASAGLDSDTMGSPLLPQDILQEAVPGNIRQAKTFVELMGTMVVQLDEKLKAANERGPPVIVPEHSRLYGESL
jgi:DNA excision repair protein ERCC-2